LASYLIGVAVICVAVYWLRDAFNRNIALLETGVNIKNEFPSMMFHIVMASVFAASGGLMMGYEQADAKQREKQHHYCHQIRNAVYLCDYSLADMDQPPMTNSYGNPK
jgi:hypothetical protein